MSIYLIRHTTPLIEKGICYGQLDIDVTDSFQEEATGIQHVLPAGIEQVYSSPLIRCQKLASYLFPNYAISLEPDLMELACGEWEGIHWDAIPFCERMHTWRRKLRANAQPGNAMLYENHQWI